MTTQELSIATTKSVARTLTTLDFQQLADVPPALTWFANIDNPQTRRATDPANALVAGLDVLLCSAAEALVSTALLVTLEVPDCANALPAKLF